MMHDQAFERLKDKDKPIMHFVQGCYFQIMHYRHALKDV
ncbi:hypothetical protein B4073_3071 [Bacillus subtilis]|nr:hypothetical protein B4068_0830 [Bacillus subtilis]KIN43631.1 hypothetical protein B4073_3071 [Bacillus subtilis]